MNVQKTIPPHLRVRWFGRFPLPWGVFALILLALAWMLPHFPAAATEAATDTVILSGCEIDYPPFCIVDESGRVDGFSVELLRAALSAMNREVSFRTGTWAEVRGWLERGEVEALPLVGRTPERELLFDFTVPYMTLHGAIVVRKGVTHIHDLSDLRGSRVAVMKGDNAEEFLRREERGIEIHYDQPLLKMRCGNCPWTKSTRSLFSDWWRCV